VTLRVSDHAVLRYLERAGGFEIERLRAAIAAAVSPAAHAGARYIHLDGVVFVIRDGAGRHEGLVITTVLTPKTRCLERYMRPEEEL